MADSIIAQITANRIADILKITTTNGYNTNILYCEEERLTERSNDQYPRVTLCGPAINISPENTEGDKYELEYTAIYTDTLDDSGTSDTPVTRQARNVSSDIIKGIMVDHTCGGLAIINYPTESSYTLDFGPNNEPLFAVVVTFKVETYLNKFNPYIIG
jgi:hypothetical protein